MGAYADPGSVDACCPGCGAKDSVRSIYENRGKYQMMRCGSETMQGTAKNDGCKTVFEQTTVGTKEKYGKGNTAHAGARRGGLTMWLGDIPGDWHERIFGPREA
jgi:hypothetical protein